MENAGGWVLKFLVIFVGLIILAVFPWLVIPAVIVLVGCFIYSVVKGVDIPEGLVTLLVGIVILFLVLVFFAIFPWLIIPLLIIAVLYNIIKGAAGAGG